MTNNEIPIEFTGRHEPLTERMKDHATGKIARLGRYHKRISSVQIIAEHPHDSPLVEMIIHVDSGKTLVAKERSDSFGHAIDELVEKMERQLKKDNEKRKDHHRGNGGKAVPPPGGGDEDEETYEDIVRKDLGPS